MDPSCRPQKLDPLGHSAVLDYRECFPLLGVPVEVQTNDQSVMEIVRSAFSPWHRLPTSLLSSRDPVVIKIIIHPASKTDFISSSMTYRLYENCFLASGEGIILTANRDHGSALAFVTPEALQNEPHFRRNVVDCLALFLATRHDRTPVHASVLIVNHTAVMLTGPSGSGKSTLAYALYRDGWKLLTEDAVYVSTENELRLWGHPTTINLCPDAKRFFPELTGLQETLQPNGKLKICVDSTQDDGGLDSPLVFQGKIVLIVIERNAGGETSLQPLGPEEAYLRLIGRIETGFDLSADFCDVARRLADNAAFILYNGKKPGDAVEAIRRIVAAHDAS